MQPRDETDGGAPEGRRPRVRSGWGAAGHVGVLALMLLAGFPARAEEASGTRVAPASPAPFGTSSGEECHGAPASDAPRLASDEAQPRVCQLRGVFLSASTPELGASVRLTDVPPASATRDLHLMELNRSRIKMNMTALAVLAGWTVANIAVSTVGYFATDADLWRAFHLSNVVFNVPVLGTAVVGAILLAKQDPERLTLEESLYRGVMLERVLLVGVALDVMVSGFGVFLLERGRRIDSDHLRGWGTADVFQGVTLLLYDSALFLLNARYSSKLILMLSPEPRDGAGLAWRMRF